MRQWRCRRILIGSPPLTGLGALHLWWSGRIVGSLRVLTAHAKGGVSVIHASPSRGSDYDWARGRPRVILHAADGRASGHGRTCPRIMWSGVSPIWARGHKLIHTKGSYSWRSRAPRSESRGTLSGRSRDSGACLTARPFDGCEALQERRDPRHAVQRCRDPRHAVQR